MLTSPLFFPTDSLFSICLQYHSENKFSRKVLQFLLTVRSKCWNMWVMLFGTKTSEMLCFCNKEVTSSVIWPRDTSRWGYQTSYIGCTRLPLLQNILEVWAKSNSKLLLWKWQRFWSLCNQSLRVWKRNSGWSFTERDFTSNEISIGERSYCNCDVDKRAL